MTLDLDFALRRLQIAPHPDLVAHLNDAPDWLETFTDDGDHADYVIEWRETVAIETGLGQRNVEHGPDLEFSHELRTAIGTFDNLLDTLIAILRHPNRTADAVIELDLNPYAVAYRGDTIPRHLTALHE